MIEFLRFRTSAALPDDRGSRTQWILRAVTTWGLPDDWKAACELERNNIKLHVLSGWRIGVVLVVAAIASAAVADHKRTEFIAAIFAGGALVITYSEWMLGRRESSMDRFYERLETANEHRSNQLVHRDLKMDETERYIFTELDNLEYVIERYRFGYMSAGLARRGLNTFNSRFGIRGFEEQVATAIERGCAYNVHTRDVVLKLIADRRAGSAAGDASISQVA